MNTYKGNQNHNSFDVRDFPNNRRESTVSSPLGFNFRNICTFRSFTYNGMLCWPGYMIDDDDNLIIGLDPFMIKDSNMTSSSTNIDDITDHYQCCFFRLVVENEM